jgi:hypothetical protein
LRNPGINDNTAILRDGSPFTFLNIWVEKLNGRTEWWFE